MNNDDRAYIVVHGFCGSPKDVESIKNELIKNGIDENNIYLPYIKFHTNTELIDLGYDCKDMVEDLKVYISYVKKKYRQLVLIGYSMGGLISIGVALENPTDTLILINTPIHIWNFKNFIWTLKKSDLSGKKYHIETVASSFEYNRLKNSFYLGKLTKYILKNLYSINIDTLIIQSTHDYVAKPSSAAEIYSRIHSERKEIRWYDRTTHYIPDEEDISDVIDYAVKWVNLSEKQ